MEPNSRFDIYRLALVVGDSSDKKLQHEHSLNIFVSGWLSMLTFSNYHWKFRNICPGWRLCVLIAHAYRTGKHIMWFKYFVWRWPAVKMKMRNDLLSISMAEHNLSDPDVRELSYRCVRIHWGLDLPSNAQYFSDATAQVFLKNYARDSFWKTGENLNIFRYNLAPLVTRKLYNSEVRNAKKYKNTVMLPIL